MVTQIDSPTLYKSLVAPLVKIDALAGERAGDRPEVACESLEVAEEFNRTHEFLAGKHSALDLRRSGRLAARSRLRRGSRGQVDPGVD